MNIISKTGCILSLLSLVLFGLCSILLSKADKEVIASGVCPKLAESAPTLGKDSPTWYYHGDDNCHICNAENSIKSWLITKVLPTKNAELVHVDITVSFSDCAQCKNQLLKVLALQENLPANMKADKVIEKLNSLPVLKEIKNETTGTKENHHVPFVSNSDGVQIVFLVEGACVVVYNIEVYSFFCNDTSIDGLHLPKTVSPASGNRTANSSCYNNTVPSSKQVFGLCGSDGEWKYVTPCFCKEGLTFDRTGCHDCPINTYKDHIGNDPCSPCPLNSKSARQAVRGCECKEGYYRFSGDNYTAADMCHGIPSAVKQVNFIKKSGKSVLIQWSPPSRMINKVFYDVACFTCRGDICKVPCGGKIVYTPSQFNMTTLSVIVENLQPDTQYSFVVRSKNNNSNMINASKWSSDAAVKINTGAGPSSVSNSLSIVFILPLALVSSLLLIILLVLFYKKRHYCRGENSQNENNYSVPQLQDSGQVVNIPADAESTELEVLDQQNSQDAHLYANPYMELSLRPAERNSYEHPYAELSSIVQPEHQYQSLLTTSDSVPHDPEDPYEPSYLTVIP